MQAKNRLFSTGDVMMYEYEIFPYQDGSIYDTNSKNLYKYARQIQILQNPNDIVIVPQDIHLTKNQEEQVRCGDNGIFKGMPLTNEQKTLSYIVKDLYKKYPTDGKYILYRGKLIACQSNADKKVLEKKINSSYTSSFIVNPLGDWTGGTDVDTGATNRKLGSDMADSVTGGGLHGKDLSKADVSVNIYAFLKAQETGKPVELCCAIGDETIDGKPYDEIVKIARDYIRSVGGFERFAEWGLY